MVSDLVFLPYCIFCPMKGFLKVFLMTDAAHITLYILYIRVYLYMLNIVLSI